MVSRHGLSNAALHRTEGASSCQSCQTVNLKPSHRHLMDAISSLPSQPTQVPYRNVQPAVYTVSPSLSVSEAGWQGRSTGRESAWIPRRLGCGEGRAAVVLCRFRRGRHPMDHLSGALLLIKVCQYILPCSASLAQRKDRSHSFCTTLAEVHISLFWLLSWCISRTWALSLPSTIEP
jgi:hypothetical protein